MGIPGTFVGSEQQTDLVSSTWFGPVTGISYQRSISVVPRLNNLNVKTTMDPKAVLLSAAIVQHESSLVQSGATHEFCHNNVPGK